MSEGNGLPKGWAEAPLSCVTSINPSRGEILCQPDSLVHFVPMASVAEEFGGVNVSTSRPYSEVQKGYTAFRENDVLFAKITPCMENGKLAVVPPLRHGLGFGSTEFHVLRPTDAVTASWVAHFLSQSGKRKDARRNMTGSAGQLRVPTTWFHDQMLPIPPLPEQHRIIEKIEEILSDLDAGVASLERAKANLKRYKASVLKSAVEGRLTEDWRKEHPQTEDGQMLLDRILRERREKWEKDQLAQFKKKGKEPPKNWHNKYEEPSAPDTSELPELPEGWVWATVEQVASEVVDCPHSTPKWEPVGMVCVRTTEFRPGRLDLGQVRYVSPQTYSERTQRLVPQANDILYSREGGILGIACRVPQGIDLCLGQRMMLVRCRPHVGSAFVEAVLNSSLTLARVRTLTTGSASPHLNVGEVRQFPIPLPPLAEQEQIVALVEERLSQIDSAEKTIDAELIRSKRLRQSILKRAFEGKLVPQDPKDEPAGVLLERLKASREHEQPKKKTKKARVSVAGKAMRGNQ
jgi:type I restriction enzyme S subunit